VKYIVSSQIINQETKGIITVARGVLRLGAPDTEVITMAIGSPNKAEREAVGHWRDSFQDDGG